MDRKWPKMDWKWPENGPELDLKQPKMTDFPNFFSIHPIAMDCLAWRCHTKTREHFLGQKVAENGPEVAIKWTGND